MKNAILDSNNWEKGYCLYYAIGTSKSKKYDLMGWDLFFHNIIVCV